MKGSHIDSITCKANKTLSILFCNMKCYTRKVKNLTSTSLVCPVVEYAAPVLDPYKNSQINQVEQIQRKAAKYVLNDYKDRTPGAASSRAKAR